MSATFKKKSSTIILIGDPGGYKTHALQFLYAACLGTTPDEFYSLKDKVPLSEITAGGSSLHAIQCTDGTQLNVLDTPGLGETHDEAQVTAIKHAIGSLVTTIDAVVVVMDQSQTALGAGVEPTLRAIFSIFPRPVTKNTFFWFRNPAFRHPEFCLAQENWPSWLLDDQFFGPIEDMVEMRTYLWDRYPNLSAGVRSLFSKPFKRALEGLQDLLEQVGKSSPQAWDMKILYRRATKIESSIHHALCLGDGTSAASNDSTSTADEKKNIQKVVKLVEEYLLLSTSPDFMAHLGLVIALLHTNQGIGRIDSCIGKLEDAKKALQTLETDGGSFSKGFVIC